MGPFGTPGKDVKMLDTFLFAFNAVAPLLLLMLLGFYLNHIHFFSPEMLKKMNTFTFRFGISAMMFRNVYALSGLSDIHMNLAAFILFCCVALTGVGVAEALVFTRQRNRRGVMIQNGFRSNFAIIGILLATSLGGSEGAGVASSMQAPTIIYFNVVAVICLTVYSDREGQRVNLAGILKSIAQNPMILGQVCGVACLALRQIIPRDASGELVFSLQRDLPFLYSAIDQLASMAAPLILVILGAQVNFSAIGTMKKELVVGVLQRLVLAPAIGFVLAFGAQALGLLQLTPAVVSALVGVFGSPVASASAPMVEEMGGDAELARQYVVWTYVLSMLTLMVWIFGFRRVGLL